MENRTLRSQQLYAEARRYLPGGVDSPVRAFKAVGGEPLFMARARGSRIFDADGSEYIDYVGSWGPMILGHAHPQVVAAVREALEHGTSFGAPTERETVLARLICEALPSMDMIRFVNSGTEAAMSALRLARAFTGRDKVAKFAGCYHGHADGLLAEAGSGVATLGIPGSPGVPAATAGDTLVAPYNDIEAVGRIFERYPGEIAAVIVEPVAANMGVVPPLPGFLEGLRRLTTDHGALLVFDEVITGFRLGYGGAQGLFGIGPDLTCLGKVIGGGLPVGAYGGRRDVMEMIAPSGQVYQAGTLSGNPLAMAAGIETIRMLAQPEVYPRLENAGAALERGVMGALAKAKVPAQVSRMGSLLTVFFTQQRVVDYASASRADTAAFAVFHRAMLSRGIYWPPSQFEAAFVSTAHTIEDIRLTVEAIEGALKAVQK